MGNQKRQLFVPGPPKCTKSVSFPSEGFPSAFRQLSVSLSCYPFSATRFGAAECRDGAADHAISSQRLTRNAKVAAASAFQHTFGTHGLQHSTYETYSDSNGTTILAPPKREPHGRTRTGSSPRSTARVTSSGRSRSARRHAQRRPLEPPRAGRGNFALFADSVYVC